MRRFFKKGLRGGGLNSNVKACCFKGNYVNRNAIQRVVLLQETVKKRTWKKGGSPWLAILVGIIVIAGEVGTIKASIVA